MRNRRGLRETIDRWKRGGRLSKPQRRTEVWQVGDPVPGTDGDESLVVISIHGLSPVAAMMQAIGFKVGEIFFF